MPRNLSRSASELGLGCVTFGREIDRPTSFAMLDHAAELGWTHLDTAAAYGGGASEQIVGEWLGAARARDKITLSTKVLPPYSARELDASIGESLRRLHVDAIDLLYLHRWDASATDPDTLRALGAQMRAGRIRRLGASNFSALQLQGLVERNAAVDGVCVGALQNVNNVALPAIDEPTRRTCAANGIDIVTYSPLGAGFLTGKYTDGVPAGSRFAVIPGHQNLYFTPTARARLARLQAVAERERLSLVDLALAWALHQPQVATVLVGGRSPAQLDQAMRARSFERLDLLAELEIE